MRLRLAFAHSFPSFEKQCRGLYANCTQQSMVLREANSIQHSRPDLRPLSGNFCLVLNGCSWGAQQTISIVVGLRLLRPAKHTCLASRIVFKRRPSWGNATCAAHMGTRQSGWRLLSGPASFQ